MESLFSIYKSRQEKFQQTAETLQAKYQKFAIIRLIVFTIGAAIGIFMWANFGVVIGFISIAILLFAFSKFVFWHLAIQKEQEHQASLATINANEIEFLNNNYAHFESGEEFVDPQHPYTVDLDIFGKYSFFQYCNRTSTVVGRGRLSEYLTPAPQPPKGGASSLNSQTNTSPPFRELGDKIHLRQNAIKELHTKLDWRQNFQALGLATEDDLQHLQLLKSWLKEPPFVLPSKGLKLALWLIPIWTILSILLTIYVVPLQFAILLLIPQGLIMKNTMEQINKTHNQTTHAEKVLAYYAKLIAHIENGSFKSEKLKGLQQAFLTKEKTASQNIGELSRIIRQLNVRYNAFSILLSISVMWDLKYILQLEKWKEKLKNDLPNWFEALAEFEAVLSLSTLYYNNQDWIFPEINDEPLFAAKALGHPLISKDKRICNDIEIPTNAHIKLITGSNMAGKSTFLRTIGLNIVLAMSGSPVCADKLSLPMLQVYTSMRTQDALHESTSSFYAELKRLKFIIEAVENGDNIFFLLDEILKGTNSNDRHTGSKALIRQLIKSKGSGIIATHDLELGQLEAKAEGAIENLCIEVEIKDEKLFFDYKLKKGVSQSFNATVLMKSMGIRIDE